MALGTTLPDPQYAIRDAHREYLEHLTKRALGVLLNIASVCISTVIYSDNKYYFTSRDIAFTYKSISSPAAIHKEMGITIVHLRNHKALLSKELRNIFRTYLQIEPKPIQYALRKKISTFKHYRPYKKKSLRQRQNRMRLAALKQQQETASTIERRIIKGLHIS